MSKLDALRKAQTREHVAALLGYKLSALSYVVFVIPKDAKYTTFEIQKKSGGVRRIDSPIAKLKVLQKRLAKLLYECLEEVEKSQPRKNSLSHAFRKEYSIVTNAKHHKSRRYVLNLDLKDFFPSLHFGRVRGFFLSNNHFKLAEPVATLLAQIACHDGGLPQGSPCSPILSELLTHFLDMRLVRLAERNKCTYTRYADDITFSTNQRAFPTALALAVENVWVLGDELKSRIIDAGFVINDAKTRMHLSGSQQKVTGLVVNEKVNISQQYYKLARAMTYSFINTGQFKFDGKESKSIIQLEGRLSHIFYVKERQIDISIETEKNEEKRAKLRLERTKQKNEHPTSIRRAYRQVVFFKNFIDPVKPLIVCEGPTDAIYLKCAIRRRYANHPLLASEEDEKLAIHVNFHRYSKQSRDILQLTGGSSDLKFFLEAWARNISAYKYRPMRNPVVILIDNDDGALQIFGLLKGKRFNITASFATDIPFYYLGENLYLVKTPTRGADHKSCIEDFFDPELLKTKIEGKTLNLNKEHDAPGEYGKAIFAEAVVRADAANIDFSGFDPLLSRINAIIDDYTKRILKAPPVVASFGASA